MQWIFKINLLWCHLAPDYTITVVSRTLDVMGNHVMSDRSAWFPRVIMSSSHALCGMLLGFPHWLSTTLKKIVRDKHWKNTKRSMKVAKELFADYRSNYMLLICVFLQAIRFRFCDIQYNQGLYKGYQPQASFWLITSSSILMILDITKTSFNNCYCLNILLAVRSEMDLNLRSFLSMILPATSW
mgnify:CR=1 FL=1